MGQVVVHGELHDALERLGRIGEIEVERALGPPHVAVDGLEYRDEQLLLAAEVIVNHALVRARSTRDQVDARAAEPALREHLHRRLQNRVAGVDRWSVLTLLWPPHLGPPALRHAEPLPSMRKRITPQPMTCAADAAQAAQSPAPRTGGKSPLTATPP